MYTTSLENRFKKHLKNDWNKKLLYKKIQNSRIGIKSWFIKKIPYSKNCYPPSPINFYQHLVPSLWMIDRSTCSFVKWSIDIALTTFERVSKPLLITLWCSPFILWFWQWKLLIRVIFTLSMHSDFLFEDFVDIKSI